VEAAITLAALPVAAVVLSTLLRSPSLGGRLVAVPTGARWHDRTTPLFGGVGIAAGLLTGILLALATGVVDPSWLLAGIVAGCAIVFLAGLVDDVRHLSPVAKLVAQLGAAAIVIAAGLRVELVSNDVLGVVIALVWLVGITNAFNLLDNMDGLAATLATVACVYFAIDASTTHENDLVLVLSLSLAFACLGFLPFNLRPGDRARVFMGDSGSQLLGFLLAVLGLVTVRRLAERRPVTQGGKDHTSHRLVYFGLSETRAVLLLALIGVALGATGVAYNVLDRPAITALGILVTFALLVQFGSFLAELSEHERQGRPGDTSLRHAITVQPRRLIELGVDALLVGGTLLAVYLLFVDGRGTELQRGTFQAVLPIVLGTTYVVYVVAGVYRRVWRFATTRDLGTIALASLVATTVAWAIVIATRDLGDFPRAVFPVYAVAAAALAVLSRALVRFVPAAGSPADGRKRVLVLGAGHAGRGLVRALRQSQDVQVVGFLDDNPRLHRRRVQGVPVLGTTEDAPAVLSATAADELVITIPDVAADRLASLIDACEAAGVGHRVVASDTVTGRTVSQALAA
jgi:UDP-GlcNAc:undecaprenyl-phosphate/decaprenyl-phosphate GlcNAc-1-phosphate transferase